MIYELGVLLKKIKTRVFCNVCKQWNIPDEGKTYLPIHKDQKTGKKCRNSHYSYDELEYFVETTEEAIALAEFIKEDKGECLDRGGMHSINCGDGDDCEEIRRLLSKALAEYVLAQTTSTSEQTKEKKT